jgi:hypothetical protein
MKKRAFTPDRDSLQPFIKKRREEHQGDLIKYLDSRLRVKKKEAIIQDTNLRL